MHTNFRPLFFFTMALLWGLIPRPAEAQLKSWNEPYRSAIIKHIERVTTKGSPDYIPFEDRIAAFDLDGTMITERPDYFHGFISKQYLLDRIKKDPSLLENEVYKKVHDKDHKWLRHNLKPWLVESFADEKLEDVYTYSQKVFSTIPPDPKGLTYDKMWYLPVVELIEYLKMKKFQVYIVSTAQQEIIRAVLTKWLKIEPVRILGSMAALKTGKRGKAVGQVRRAKDAWLPFCHGRGKVLRFRERVGKPPVFGAGNSTNDIALLYYATTSKYKNMNIIIHHDDPREKQYTKQKLLDISKKEKWLVVSMQKGFKEVYGDISFVKPASAYLTKPCKKGKHRHRSLLFTSGIGGVIVLLIGAVVLLKLRRS